MTIVPKMTLDLLAEITRNGFAEVHQKINVAVVEIVAIRSTMATKAELRAVEARLDRIESIILTDHRNRLDRVEDKIRILETEAKK